MSEMVHLLLQLSRVESVHRSDSEVVNISRIAEVVAAEHENKADEKDITMNVSIDSSLYVRANSAYIEEIINNLLENAVKYTPHDEKINLQLRRSSGKVVLHLSDTGIGFDEQTKKHLFERFYRADESGVQKQSGSGLGLPLVKAIVELYGGKIRAYSDGPGEGSTFVVELPLSDVNEA